MISHATIGVAGGSTAQATTSTAAKLTAFSTSQTSRSYNGGDLSCKPDAANDKITISNFGTYLVVFSVSFSLSAAAEATFQLRNTAVAIAHLICGGGVITADANIVRGSGFSGVYTPSSTDAGPAGTTDLEVYVGTSNSMDTTVKHAQLSVMRID